MDQTKIKPSAWLYFLAPLVMIAGAACFALFLFGNLSGLGDSLTRIVVPGKGEVELRDAGKYIIFHEYQSVVGDKIYSGSDSLAGLQCAVRSRATGAQIKLMPASMSSSYSVGSRAGASAFEFTIDQPGVYEVSGGYPAGQAGPETVLAIGRGFIGTIFGTVFGGLAIMFGSFLIAIAIVVVIFVKRRKSKKQIESLGANPNFPTPSRPGML
jgi:hypothetical protein